MDGSNGKDQKNFQCGSADQTPKTLKQAIDNGLNDQKQTFYRDNLYFHIKDFLAQKFGPAYLQYPDKPEIAVAIEKVWKAIFNEP